MKYILGIETTAHTFGVAVLDFDGNILSNVKDMYKTKKGGMIPMEVAKHHNEVAERVWQDALKVKDTRTIPRRIIDTLGEK